ncbi:MAG: O-phosphoseryl-tRNA(Sec) selenium transferase [Candidatus Helarchaeota archaeon]
MKDFEFNFSDLIPANMERKGETILKAIIQPIKTLWQQRKIPEDGWNDKTIELCLKIFSEMDTDKDPKAARIGEREARLAAPILSKLSFGFNHGIGRSGEIAAPQPKAPGSSIMYQISNRLALQALKKFGIPNIAKAIVLPLSTGMSIGLTFAAIRKKRNQKEVLCTRIDHTSPLKGLELVGLKPQIIDSRLNGDAVQVDPDEIRKHITSDTLGILSTTTFFPPRESDFIKEIAKIAQEKKIYHVINNAYGVQSRQIMKKIQGAIDAGRVDAVIQSTDKNFLTPIGGAIVATPLEDFCLEISKCYAGRATAAPIIQFLAAILALGIQGYEKLRDSQEVNRELLERLLNELAEEHDERVLHVDNPIACAVTLNQWDPIKVGGALYELRVTGPRAYRKDKTWGACFDNYPNNYLCLNAAIGTLESDIRTAIQRLKKALKQVKSQQ